MQSFLSIRRPRRPPNNGADSNTAQILKAVMSSAAEVELCTVFVDAREVISTRKALKEMGYKQP